jgi:hypothetical protein
MPVLRKQEGVPWLVGSVYVCGAIDGEAIGELLANGSLIEEVVIVWSRRRKSDIEIAISNQFYV